MNRAVALFVLLTWFACTPARSQPPSSPESSGQADPFQHCVALLKNEEQAAAISCLQPLAEAGDVRAEAELGIEYSVANEPAYDPDKSAIWLKKAAEHGSADAQFQLGGLYADGKGVPKDLSEAMRWRRKAADGGLQLAQIDLALMYVKGLGGPKDAVQAISWLRKAADQGGPWGMTAEQYIGDIYLRGDGVAQDYAEAASWLRKAAQHGSARAYLTLAQLDEKGLGGPADPYQAYVEYSIALTWLHSTGVSGPLPEAVATRRADVAAKLTAVQKTQADRFARDHAISTDSRPRP
jgi:hypothetical protein